MRNNAPVENCAAVAFILYREIVLTMEAGIALCAYLMIKNHGYCAMKNKNQTERLKV